MSLYTSTSHRASVSFKRKGPRSVRGATRRKAQEIKETSYYRRVWLTSSQFHAYSSSGAWLKLDTMAMPIQYPRGTESSIKESPVKICVGVRLERVESR
jgi:hypothetical protein